MRRSHPRSENDEAALTRRRFLQSSLAVSALAASPFEALASSSAHRAQRSRHSPRAPRRADYGPLAPAIDASTGAPLLELPSGFDYHSLAWTGDPIEKSTNTPDRHDGMAAFYAGWGRIALIRNHERDLGTALGGGAPVYDRAAAGGTTSLMLGAYTAQPLWGRISLAGTLRNCAGGPTPWRSWISCEETLLGPGDFSLEQEHGFCFEVPVYGQASAQPLRDMGRFAHEAVAFDLRGRAYLTEDDGESSGFYRFTPHRYGRLAQGGRLEMLRVVGADNYDTRAGQTVGARLPIDWVPIDLPAPSGDRVAVRANSVFGQGFALGGARFRRNEGCWRGGNRIYFTSTTGGDAKKGQIWVLNPRRRNLKLIYESPAASVLDKPDNIAVSPRGGLVVCEDGSGQDLVHGLTRRGELFPLVRNTVQLTGERGFIGDFRSSEFAGACWSPWGRWLFVNVQAPGITFAIRGPWYRGAL